jgi:hypothetical protein
MSYVPCPDSTVQVLVLYFQSISYIYIYAARLELQYEV